MTGAPGVTLMVARVAGLTVKAVVPDTPSMVAVMVVEPALTAVRAPVLEMEAMADVPALQLTEEEMSRFEPSL